MIPEVEPTNSSQSSKLSTELKRPIWERTELTDREVLLGKVITVLVVSYAVVGLFLKVGVVAEIYLQPVIFIEIYHQLEIFQHFTSLLATLAVFLVVKKYVVQGLNKAFEDQVTPEELRVIHKKWGPTIMAVLAAFFHWYAESGVGGKGMGVLDMSDAVYGVLSVFPVYIMLEWEEYNRLKNTK